MYSVQQCTTALLCILVLPSWTSPMQRRKHGNLAGLFLVSNWGQTQYKTVVILIIPSEINYYFRIINMWFNLDWLRWEWIITIIIKRLRLNSVGWTAALWVFGWALWASWGTWQKCVWGERWLSLTTVQHLLFRPRRPAPIHNTTSCQHCTSCKGLLRAPHISAGPRS